MAARKPVRVAAVGRPRPAQDIEAEFAGVERFTPAGSAPVGKERLRLSLEPQRPPLNKPGPQPVAGPMRTASPADVRIEKLVRQGRRAAMFAAIMATLAFGAAVVAALAALSALAG